MMYKVLVLAILVAAGYANDCIPRSFGSDSIVCVCNGTYCDGTPDQNPVQPENGFFYRYTSSKAGKRLAFSKGNISQASTDISLPSTVRLKLDDLKTYQRITGFGGAFTDAAGINIRTLSTPTQQQVIRTYFSPLEGSRYSFGRIPIGGTDFSTRPYTLDDVGPNNLNNFSLTNEDYNYKIPLVKYAIQENSNIKFFAAAWSAPGWMKTNNNITGKGFLKDEYYQMYADYMLKFLDSYKKAGIHVWALSTGNEPDNAWYPFVKFNKMGWTPSGVGKWVANNLGPSLANSEFRGTKIMCNDDQRVNLPWYIKSIFLNGDARKYIDIIAIHYYLDRFVLPWRLDETHKLFPEKTLLMTEACLGTEPGDGGAVVLGSWKRAETYILDIMQNLNHYVTGWVDWNLALNKQGGPNWAGNYADASIIVNPDDDEFYKQPMYYAIKHFSRFVPAGSVKIHLNNNIDIVTIAFVTPQNDIVIILYNRTSKPKMVAVKDVCGGTITVDMEPKSIDTIICQK